MEALGFFEILQMLNDMDKNNIDRVLKSLRKIPKIWLKKTRYL